MNVSCLCATLLLAPMLAHASGRWMPVPAALWAPQAVVPPGTNNTRAVQVVPLGGTPVAPAQNAVFPPGVPGQPPPPAPGGGQRPPLPPGVPNPAAAPAKPGLSISPAGGTGAAPATPVNPAAAAAAIAGCEATSSVARLDIPPTGGEFALPATLKPVGCPVQVTFAAPWLKMVDASGLRFAAEPNATAAARDAVIVMGAYSFFVRQISLPQPGLAAAPSRLVFGVSNKGGTNKKVFTAWSEREAAAFVVRPAHPWITVTAKKSKNGRQAYEVAVRPDAELKPGRHDSYLTLSTLAAPARSVVIPIVVEVEGLY